MDQESTATETDESQKDETVEGQTPAEESKDEKPGQEPDKTFDEKYVRGLRREAAEARKRATEAEDKLKELEDRDKTESERLGEKVAETELRAKEAELKVMRFEVAADRGLEMKAAAFLTGTTREELETRADELVELLADKPKKTPSLDGGARKTAEKRGTPEEEHNELLLRALGRKS